MALARGYATASHRRSNYNYFYFRPTFIVTGNSSLLTVKIYI